MKRDKYKDIDWTLVDEISLMKVTGMSLTEIQSWDEETAIAVSGMYEGFEKANQEQMKNAKKK